jgi:predicted nucleic acid-binding Zn ribbon protein
MGISQMPPSRPKRRPAARSAAAGFASLRDVLEGSPAMRRIREYLRQQDLREIWVEVAGETVGAHTRVRHFRGGKLFVDVSSAALLQELATFRKARLLAQLKERDRCRGIVDIVFRHG